jgi:hypothetical protein
VPANLRRAGRLSEADVLYADIVSFLPVRECGLEYQPDAQARGFLPSRTSAPRPDMARGLTPGYS